MVGNDPKSKAKETKETPEGVKSNGGILYPNIWGTMYPYLNWTQTDIQGACKVMGTDGLRYAGSALGAVCRVDINGNYNSAIYARSQTVQPESARVYYLIKY